jgi:hypothetical protein
MTSAPIYARVPMLAIIPKVKSGSVRVPLKRYVRGVLDQLIE